MSPLESWWRMPLRVTFWTWLVGVLVLAAIYVAIPLLELAHRDAAVEAARLRLAPGRHAPKGRQRVVIGETTRPMPVHTVAEPLEWQRYSYARPVQR